MTTTAPLLGDFSIEPDAFPDVDTIINSFEKGLPKHTIFRQICEKLLHLIEQAPARAFLLPAIVDFLGRVNQAQLIDEKLTFSLFEFWLNHFSGLDDSDNAAVRGKIIGKLLPRNAYQVFFPIGMGKMFPHSHFVAAHLSPDVDTMIASFWGWADAFAARVSSGTHFWNLPGGPPESPTTTLFKEMLGKEAFEILPRTANSLTLSAVDLVTHKNLSRKHGGISISSLDHGINERAIIMINENGHYIGDWRSSDVEMVRQVIILFKAILRWFENNLQTQLVTLFAKEDLSTKDIEAFLNRSFHIAIEKCETAVEFSDIQTKYLQDFFTKVLALKTGLAATFSDLNETLDRLGISAMLKLQGKLENLAESGLFDSSGRLNESRPEMFEYIKHITDQLNEAIHEVRNFAERLDISMQIKEKVLGISPESIQMQTDVDVISQKMQNDSYLTVTISEKDGCQYPVGVVWAKDLRQSILGTVSFRDFCNYDEVKMASYLTVISVIDHHKSVLKTNSPPLAIIGDAQACNVLVAEQEMRLNDQFSLLGATPSEIHPTLNIEGGETPRLMERLMRRQLALQQDDQYFVHPLREYMEYLLFVHAILDDTDLLTKVTARDVICTAELLNRLKSLQLQRDVEIITLDDIPEDENFAQEAAKRILQNEDMYSIYKKSFDYREKEVEESLRLCAENKPSTIFSDAKTQNRSTRISQTKLFSGNIAFYLKHAREIQAHWTEEAASMHKQHNEIDLYIHMISTIASAEEVYHDAINMDDHQDELWFWIPETPQGLNRLASFLSNFRESPEMMRNTLSLEVHSEEAADIFRRYFISIADVSKYEDKEQKAQPAAILRFKAGSLNSRKAMVSPYVPRSVT